MSDALADIDTPGDFYRVMKIICTGMALVVALIFIWLILPGAHAAVFVYGSNYNYSEVVLPNGSYVHQGENISQGNYYDLNGVYGFSGIIGHWKDENGIGIYAPDDIITLDGNTRKLTYIAYDKFPVGRWYQWDGITCKEHDFCTSSFGHGNNYIFAVVKGDPYAAEKLQDNVTHYSEIIVIFDGNITQTIAVDKTRISATPNAIESLDQSIPIHTIVLPTAEPTENPVIEDIIYVTMEEETINPAIKEVAPRSDPFWLLGVIAVLAVVLFRRN